MKLGYYRDIVRDTQVYSYAKITRRAPQIWDSVGVSLKYFMGYICRLHASRIFYIGSSKNWNLL